jgi:hypothetical protein
MSKVEPGVFGYRMLIFTMRSLSTNRPEEGRALRGRLRVA